MNAIQLLLLSLGILGLGAALSLLLLRAGWLVRLVTGLAGAAASVAGLAAAIMAARSPSGLELPTGLPFGPLSLQMDGLSSFMVALISLVTLAVSLHSLSPAGAAASSRPGLLGFHTQLFIASMLLLVTVSNAFYFLFFWEIMTLVSYFLVTFNDSDDQAVRAGYMYMLIAQAGAALILISFLVLYIQAGSLSFEAIRQAQLPPAVRDLVFLLAFVGFAAKAGVVPLHFWMPPAYAAAPAGSAALMASVMKTSAIYAMLRFCADLLGTPSLWWAMVVLLFGAVSLIGGALFALAEPDLKRMLSYSSIENLGIILLGMGAGMAGLASHRPAVALVGFLAALYHALNHAFFKGLLFLGAGAVEAQLETANLNRMGGLARRMPRTAFVFLIGALSASAIPPLNGFVSEWFTYQALFTGGLSDDFATRALLPLCAVLLALGGTLAAMAAVKMYTGAFAGPPRSKRAAEAVEPPGTMLSGMGLLAVGCLLLGLGAPFVTTYLVNVVGGTFNLPDMAASSGTWIYPVDPGRGLVSMPMITLLLLGFLIVPFVLAASYGGQRAGSRLVKDPWACGYGYSSRMAVSAGSFDQPVQVTFRALYRVRESFKKPLEAVGVWSKRPRNAIIRAEPVLETLVREPTARATEYLARHIQALQMGDIRVYCFYIVLTLAVLLLVMFR